MTVESTKIVELLKQMNGDIACDAKCCDYTDRIREAVAYLLSLEA